VQASDVLAERLANQRLTGPAGTAAVDVVREQLAVQSQDAPLARAMIALRAASTEADVRQAVAAGQLVRTHVLRPTWHYVAAEDLTWLLALTSERVESSMAARHRQLSLDPVRITAGLDVISDRLSGARYATRTELGSVLAQQKVSATDELFGQRVGHLLLIAELRGLICSAPTATPEHHYALISEVLPPTPQRSREAAIAELVTRFVTSHGPIAVSDLLRWATVTGGEARAALAGSGLEAVHVGAEELWRSPTPLPALRPKQAHLLSTFDEAFLSYRKVPWLRSPGHPLGDTAPSFAQSGGGPVLSGLSDVGSWKRVRGRQGNRIELSLDAGVGKAARSAIDAAAQALSAVFASGDEPMMTGTVRS
jgi:hypothetical protein